jgi:hypothetical protein
MPNFFSSSGRFERMAMECKKPQYQSPCTGFQKFECVFSKGRWEMKPCRITSPLTSAKKAKKWCKCKNQPKFRLTRLNRAERRMQRAFLKQHTSVDLFDYNLRFLRAVSGNRQKQRGRSFTVDAASGAAKRGGPLHEVAKDELRQVDSIMEDISGKIFDLEVKFLSLVLSFKLFTNFF